MRGMVVITSSGNKNVSAIKDLVSSDITVDGLVEIAESDDEERWARYAAVVICKKLNIAGFDSGRCKAVCKKLYPERVGAKIWVPWYYDSISIHLTARNWFRILNGNDVGIRGKGIYGDGQFYWDYWSFSDGLFGFVNVQYGDGGDAFLDGRLYEDDCTIQED